MIHCGDCLAVMRTMAANSVDAIVTDPPYFKVKGDAWDWQWKKPDQFLAWMGELCAEWERILKPNGSLYVFASPKMAWGVEGEIRKRFNVLTNIRWRKPPFSTKAEMFTKSDLRSPFPASETIIFAEHYGADNIAKGEAGYEAKCDELRGFVFEPLRKYLADEMERAGHSLVSVNQAWREWKGGNGGMSSHWFTRSQWTLPTAQNYAWLREVFGGGDYLKREYDDLKREYDDLKREYDDLRRPFTVTADVPYTDLWDFPTVQAYRGKHPCEKPLALMKHIVQSSTRPGAVVLDPFAGSATTGVACVELGREFIGIEQDPAWVERGMARLGNTTATSEALDRLPLFEGAA